MGGERTREEREAVDAATQGTVAHGGWPAVAAGPAGGLGERDERESEKEIEKKEGRRSIRRKR